MEKILYIGCAVINLAAFVVCGWDKLCAKLGLWRVPERVLMGFAAVFGSVGMLLGMLVFRHKVRKPKFVYGVPALLAVQIALVAAAVHYWPIAGV